MHLANRPSQKRREQEKEKKKRKREEENRRGNRLRKTDGPERLDYVARKKRGPCSGMRDYEQFAGKWMFALAV